MSNATMMRRAQHADGRDAGPRSAYAPQPWLPILAVELLLAGCEPGVLHPRGPIGIANRTILIDSLAVMLAIVVPTIIATLGVAWWFRAGNKRARYLPDWEFSGRIELVAWAIPVMVIILLGGVTWIGAHQLDPAEPIASQQPALEIEVVSMDWKWLFIYPGQGVATLNELVVPVGVPLHFKLTSASVMNAFFIPRLGSMIYTMNGMTTQLFLQADEAGPYRGISSHYSGDGFSDMHFDVQAVDRAAFDTWVQAARGKGQTLNGDAYKALLRQSAGDAPARYGAVEPQLFDHIVMQHLPAGAGPATERKGAAQDSHAGH